MAPPTLTITVVPKGPIRIYDYGGLSNCVVQQEAPISPSGVCRLLLHSEWQCGSLVMLMSSVFVCLQMQMRIHFKL